MCHIFIIFRVVSVTPYLFHTPLAWLTLRLYIQHTFTTDIDANEHMIKVCLRFTINNQLSIVSIVFTERHAIVYAIYFSIAIIIFNIVVTIIP